MLTDRVFGTVSRGGPTAHALCTSTSPTMVWHMGSSVKGTPGFVLCFGRTIAQGRNRGRTGPEVCTRDVPLTAWNDFANPLWLKAGRSATIKVRRAPLSGHPSPQIIPRIIIVAEPCHSCRLSIFSERGPNFRRLDSFLSSLLPPPIWKLQRRREKSLETA